MRAGFAYWDITPALGAERPGGLTKAHGTGIHDPLWVRAAVFGSGRERVALVGVDALALPAPLVAAARLRTAELCGVDPGRILVAASHTHQGGPCAGTEPDPIRPEPDPEYVRRVAEAVASAVADADARAVEAWLSVGVGHEADVSFNRRFHMRQGWVMTHPGKGNPDILEPAGPIDPAVGVLAAWSTSGGALLGCVVNFACHATTLGGQAFSADWVHYLDRTLRAAMGPEAVVVFVNGACGDVTQVDNRSREASDFGERAARIVGCSVAAEAIKVLARARPSPRGDGDWPLSAASQTLGLEVRVPHPHKLAAAQALWDGSLTGEWTAERWYARELVLLAERARQEPRMACELQALQIGPLGLAANPAELFCSLGLQVKAQSPAPFTFIATLANGAIGYVPDAAAYGPQGGGYEQRLRRNSCAAVGSGERIRDASLELLRDLWAERPVGAPVWEPVPVGRPWPVGMVRGGE